MLMKQKKMLVLNFFAVKTNLHAGDAGVGRDGGCKSDGGGL